MSDTALAAPVDARTDSLEELVTDLMAEPEMPVADPPLYNPSALGGLVLVLSPAVPEEDEEES